jgi:opacity protein-like surface antigen
MNFRTIAFIASIAAASSVAMAGEGFYASLGIGAVGANYHRTEAATANDGALDLNVGQTNSIGVVDLGYAIALNKDWSLGLGLAFDLGKTKAGSLIDAGPPSLSIKFSGKNHYSLYVQPSYNLNDSTAVFGKVGYHTIKGEVIDIDGNNDSSKIHGLGYGLGLKTMVTKNVYIQTEVMWVNYKDEVGAADTNKLKTTSGLVSVGYQF